MNRSFHIRIPGYVSRNNVNVHSETLFSENSYHIVTSQLTYNANELVSFRITQVFMTQVLLEISYSAW